MGNLGGGEILVILLAALIFLGPEKLPEVARQVGKVLGEIRKVSSGFQREVQDAMRMVDDEVSAAERRRPTSQVAPPTIDTGQTGAEPPVAAPVASIEATPAPPDEPADAAPSVSPTSAPPIAAPEPDSAPAEAAVVHPPPLPVDFAHGGDR